MYEVEFINRCYPCKHISGFCKSRILVSNVFNLNDASASDKALVQMQQTSIYSALLFSMFIFIKSTHT